MWTGLRPVGSWCREDYSHRFVRYGLNLVLLSRGRAEAPLRKRPRRAPRCRTIVSVPTLQVLRRRAHRSPLVRVTGAALVLALTSCAPSVQASSDAPEGPSPAPA